MSGGRSSSFKVGDWNAEPSLNVLSRDGKTIQIEPRAMDVLAHLAAHPGEVVSIEELIEKIWEGRVTDGSVYRIVNQLRNTLEGDREDPSYIQTIPKRGYRLIADIREQEQATPKPDASSAETNSISNKASIAVLPFENLSADPENVFFADGIHGDLLTKLSKIHSLRVVSRTSVMGYRGSPKNMREIARELGVDTVLEGAVQRIGEDVRINVQMINAQSDEHIWAEVFHRELTAENIFAIQREMATAIASALEATLSPKELERINEVPTQNTKAYEFYLSAREYHRDPDRRTNLPIAIQQYQRAIEEDPKFAVAYARLSQAHSEMYWFAFDKSGSRLELAQAAAQNALSLQPELPEGHLAMADYSFSGFRNYESALRELAIAEEALPGEPDIFELRAAIYRRSGQWETALEDIARFIELDPRDVQGLRDRVATTYLALRDYANAEKILTRILEIVPDDGRAHSMRAQIPLKRDGNISELKKVAEDLSIPIPRRQHLRWMAGIYERDNKAALKALKDWDAVVFNVQDDYRPRSLFYGVTHLIAGQTRHAVPHFRAARAQLELALESNPEDDRIWVSLAELSAGLGERDAALNMIERAMELMPPSKDAITGRAIQLAAIIRVFAVLKDHARVLRELEDYLTSQGGEWSIEGLLPDPRLNFIREDPAFIALVGRHKR